MEFNEKLIKSFKRSNKARRIKLAQKAGFNTPEEYLNSLSDNKLDNTIIIKEDKKKKPKQQIVHNVTLLDATGSMAGSKYNNSAQGIDVDYSTIVSSKGIKILGSLYEFIDTNKGVINHFVKRECISGADIAYKYYGAYGGDTPLWWSVLEVLKDFENLPIDEKVLIKIYTDGGNNSRRTYLEECKAKIKELQKKNFTITFVGTKADLKNIIRVLELDESNCLEIENSGEGFKKAFETSLKATSVYLKRIEREEDVAVGFYKKIN